LTLVSRSGLPWGMTSAIEPQTFQLGFQWPVLEPFLFCVHHLDAYPKGEAHLGPAPERLAGRDIGQDFTPKDGFRMYHGDSIPGFPVHPHRGFETITVVRRGYVDHADSLGAAGRYGEGDVQWMTAGSGVQHSEMFPLLHRDQENTLELFQIWLNLPKRSKMAPAHFKMFWSEDIPKLILDAGRVSLRLISGELFQTKALTPPPASWASDPLNDVLIALVSVQPGGKLEIPASHENSHRCVYGFSGSGFLINAKPHRAQMGAAVSGGQACVIENPNDSEIEFLLLQAKPIGEPRFQHGPFVMNTREEVIQTFEEYQRTQFGGWPWPRPDMVHGEKIERFAKYPDGRIERPNKK